MSQSDRELASTFVPADIEAPLYEKWMKAGYFTADAQSDKPPYAIVIPPPNVTGVLLRYQKEQLSNVGTS